MSLSRLSLSLIFALAISTIALAQPGGRRPTGGGGGLLSLAMNEQIQEHIEMVEDQIKDVEGIQEDIREEMGDLRSQLQGLEREQMFAKFAEIREKTNKMAEEKLSDVLLPHQLKRLKQLEFQSRLRGGTERALSNDDIVDQLNITEKQQEEIEKAAEEAQEELQEKLAKIRKEAEAKVLAVLTPQQRKMWEDMAGEPFTFETRGFGGFGGAGGRGGAPGGRGGFGGRGGGRGGAPGGGRGRPQNDN